MVLLYGIAGDGPFELVADALEELEMPFVILDQARFAEIDFDLQLNNDCFDGEISIGHLSYPLSSFTGIYNRGIDFAALPAAQVLKFQREVYDRYAGLFDVIQTWIEAASCAVVNKASAMSSNASKPYQLGLIQPYFQIPETLITNNLQEVISFEKTSSEIIYKSASSVRSIVKSVDAANTTGLAAIRHCPTLFQKKLEGTNYRVHVVDNTVFAIKAETESIDYRYSHKEGNETVLTPTVLPPAIEANCIALAKALNLPFAGIDLFHTNDNEWACFEVNPSPGFSYFENVTGQPIAAVVAAYLTNTKK